MRFSIQLYSLREISEKPQDFLALFPKLKEMGFDGVEFAGYHGLGAEELRRALDEAGLVTTGTHLGLDDLKPERLAETIAFCKTLGMTRIGVGSAPHGSPAETAATCAALAAAFEAAKPQGITIYYHNHEGEFRPFEDGACAMDQLLAACAIQLDTYWSFCAGVDNEAFLHQHKDRVCSLHIKDGMGREGRALGEGNCDLAAVVRAAKAIGLEWLVLEDESLGQGLASVAKGIAWLKRNAV
ncbi:MAG: sugar phosphate isomerase/epimerase [Oscillospiraceae bacterium]|jgi:sugar phosphate isomerase/epimerase|nr:sugar phosphate isomerase/epimerase [Oscillospiraceae bacterium]